MILRFILNEILNTNINFDTLKFNFCITKFETEFPIFYKDSLSFFFGHVLTEF